ncbi:X8 domain-containing protein [Hyaloscypha finlandica]|nr:X8 domain-containing protein [Hyaloscypha finlandica]
MAVYANTLGFFAGNSRPYIATFPNTAASAFIKAIEEYYGLVNVTKNTVMPLADFNALSIQLAPIAPISTAASDYRVINTVAQTCPTTALSWKASATLPPTPNTELCSCMQSSLSCVVNQSLNTTETSSFFDNAYKAGPASCAGISMNTTTGVYGAYSVCNTTQKVSWVLNQHFLSKGFNMLTNTCDYILKAMLQDDNTHISGSCVPLLAQAGTAGTGTVTSLPTITPGPKNTTVPKIFPGPTLYNTSEKVSGLSGGAKAGITIGVVLVMGGVTGFVFYLLRRRSLRKKDDETQVPGYSVPGIGYDLSKGPTFEVQEMEARTASFHSELDGHNPRKELSGVSSRQELCGAFSTRSELSGETLQVPGTYSERGGLPSPVSPMSEVATPNRPSIKSCTYDAVRISSGSGTSLDRELREDPNIKFLRPKEDQKVV